MRCLMLCVLALSIDVACATTPTSPPAGPSEAATAAPATPALEINPYGKIYIGEGVTIEMAMLAQKNAAGVNDVIMRITGAEAFNEGIDGKVIRYAARRAGAGGTGMDIVTQLKGNDYVRMTLRNSSWEVYLNNKSLRIWVDEEKSKRLDTKKLVAELAKN